MPRLLLVGSSQLGEALLRGILAELPHRHDIELLGLFPWSYSKPGKGYQDPSETAMIQLAKRASVPLLRFPGVNSPAFHTYLSKTQPDVILVACWGEIVKSPLLDSGNDFKVINCHPSLLPAHRGPNPYTSVILTGETETGVTFHEMVKAVDAGPIVLQQSLPIESEDTGEQVRARCAETASALVPSFLDWLRTDPRPDAIVQDETRSSYYPQITLSDGIVDWNLFPEQVMRRHRAMIPWLNSYAWLDGKWLMTFQTFERQPLSALPNYEALKQTGAIQNNRLMETVLPGIVITRQLGRLWVAGSDPTEVFYIPDYRVYWWFLFLPISLSRAWGEAIIKPAMRFVSGPV